MGQIYCRRMEENALDERRHAKYVKGSIPVAEMRREGVQPELVNCSKILAPQPNTTVDGSRKMTALIVVSMTKVSF